MSVIRSSNARPNLRSFLRAQPNWVCPSFSCDKNRSMYVPCLWSCHEYTVKWDWICRCDCLPQTIHRSSVFVIRRPLGVSSSNSSSDSVAPWTTRTSARLWRGCLQCPCTNTKVVVSWYLVRSRSWSRMSRTILTSYMFPRLVGVLDYGNERVCGSLPSYQQVELKPLSDYLVLTLIKWPQVQWGCWKMWVLLH